MRRKGQVADELLQADGRGEGFKVDYNCVKIGADARR